VLARLVLGTALFVAGCGAGSAEQTSRIDRCTERFLSRAESKTAEVRRYVETTYCAPFDERGWVHDDGTLKLEAHTHSGSEACATEQVGGATRSVPCEELESVDSPQMLDCGLLDLVRRSEVSEYVSELQRRRDVRCDDGTPLDQLGAR
jgi:hypothetical protein